MTDTTTLAVQPGDGRLLRTSSAVLFVPRVDEGWQTLAEAVRDATDAAHVVDAVTGAAVASGFALPPFVLVALGERPEVVVLGDVELRTDHPALPMLSGAASATWVEHTLRPHPEPVTLEVAPPDEQDTDLAAGCVPAGGFALCLPATATAAVPDVAPAPAPEPAPATEPAEPEQAAARGDDTGTMTAVPAPAVPAGAGDAPGDATSDPAPMDRTTVLVEAVHCPEGHENRPGAAVCRRCGIAIAAGAPALQVARPVLGQLLLGDGTAYALDRDHVFGRSPAADDGERAVSLAGSKVSRTHARVTLRGWDVVVHDLGSTNGTYVVAPGEPEPHRVEPDAPARVAPGSTVYVGDQPVRYVDTPPPV